MVGSTAQAPPEAPMPTRLIEFDAAADRHVLLARHDLRGGEIDRVEAGRAEAVDLHAGDAVAIAGNERRSPRDIAAGFADRIDHAQHHVINQRGIEVVAALDRAERLACEIERSHFVERTVHFAAAARCTHVIVDESVGHGVSFANMSPTRCGQGGRAADDQEPIGLSAVKPDFSI